MLLVSRSIVLQTHRRSQTPLCLMDGKEAMARLVGIIVENLLYGICASAFYRAIWNLRQERTAPLNEGVRGRWLGKPLLICLASVLFALITMHWLFVTISQLYFYRPLLYSQVPISVNEYNTFWFLFIDSVIWTLEIVIGDFILVHRLYHICGHNFRLCVLPIGLNFVTCFAGISSVYLQAVGQCPWTSAENTLGLKLVWITFTCTILSQVYCSGSISFKPLWLVHTLNLALENRLHMDSTTAKS
jgi:hypothetical protein